jgi:hypothetical protein
MFMVITTIDQSYFLNLIYRNIFENLILVIINFAV